jgi:PAS domain S-box-containing protein
MVAVLCIVAALGWTRTVSAEPLRVAILALDAEGPMAAFWQATLNHLETALPDIRLIPEHLEGDALLAALQKQTVDCAIADPAFVAMGTLDITLLATPRFRVDGQEYSGCAGALVVRAARADLRTWSDLRTAEIAVACANTLEDWRAVEKELKARGWRGRLRRVSSRSAVLDEVASGRVEAAALPAGFLEAMEAYGAVTAGVFHVIAAASGAAPPRWPVAVSTPVYPGPAFIATDRVTPEQRRRIAAALLAMPVPPGSKHANSGVEGVGWEPYPSLTPVVMLLGELGVPPFSKVYNLTLADVVRQYMYVFIVAGLAFVAALGFIITLAALNRVLRAEVAQRREAEQSLLRSVERFEHIAACSSDWIWECDEHGVCTYTNVNLRSMLGYDVQEALGRPYLDFISALDRQRLEAEGRRLLDGGRSVFREVYRMRTKDGRVVVHEITAEPVRDAAGKVAGYRGVNRDITNRARAVRLMT